MAKRRTRRALQAPEPIEGLLERAGEDRFAKKKLPIPIAEWRAAVGPRIAERARPVTLERGVLIVKVATSVWANELQMLAPELVLRLKQRGFAVDQLRFRVGPLDHVDRPPERRAYRKVPPPAELGPELRAEVAKIADDGLRGAIEQAARANLAWQDFVQPEKDRKKHSAGAEPATTAAPRGARGPRDAGTGSAPPDRSAAGSDEASPRSSGGGRDRPR
jgi:hypothetical protein